MSLREQLQSAVVRIVSGQLDVPVVDVLKDLSQTYEGLDVDSMGMVELLIAFEDYFDITLPYPTKNPDAPIHGETSIKETIDFLIRHGGVRLSDERTTAARGAGGAGDRREDAHEHNEPYLDLVLSQDVAKEYIERFGLSTSLVRETLLKTVGKRRVQKVASAREADDKDITTSAHLFVLCERTFFHFSLSPATVAYWSVPLTDLVIEARYTFSSSAQLESAIIVYSTRAATPRFLGGSHPPMEWEFTKANAKHARHFMERLMALQEEQLG
jgi:acyl carrier protein